MKSWNGKNGSMSQNSCRCSKHFRLPSQNYFNAYSIFVLIFDISLYFWLKGEYWNKKHSVNITYKNILIQFWNILVFEIVEWKKRFQWARIPTDVPDIFVFRVKPISMAILFSCWHFTSTFAFDKKMLLKIDKHIG